MQEKIKLTYFQIPGRAEPIRLIFNIGGINFEDERLSREQFGKAKSQGKFIYGQIPVLEINGKQYAQSQAILFYAAMKSGLFPKTPQSILQVEQVTQNFEEILSKLIPTWMMQDEKERKIAREGIANDVIPLWLQRIEDLLVENGSTGYVSGKELTYGDVLLYTKVCDINYGHIDYIPAGIVDKYPQILRVVKNVGDHPKVKEWYARHPAKPQ